MKIYIGPSVEEKHLLRTEEVGRIAEDILYSAEGRKGSGLRVGT